MKRTVLALLVLLAACGGSAIPGVTTIAPTSTTTSEPETITVPATAPVVYVLGDSLTVGVEPYLRRALATRGWRLAGVDGRVNRTTAEGLQILRRKASKLPDTVLLALGSNDLTVGQSVVQDWVRQARAIVGDDRRLIWVNVYIDLTRQPKLKRYRVINDGLTFAAAKYDVEIADWDTWAKRHDPPMQRDGVHYTEQGYRLRAAFYARVVATTQQS